MRRLNHYRFKQPDNARLCLLNSACALTQNGAVQCFGENSLGQLGDASNSNHADAQEVAGFNGGSALGQTISFAPLANQAYGDAVFTVTASAASGLAVSFGTLTPTVCSIVSSGSTTATVTILTGGACTLTANQNGDTNFLAATQISRNQRV